MKKYCFLTELKNKHGSGCGF